MRGERDKDTVGEQSPKGESSSNGAAEQSKKEAEGIIQTLKSSLEERMEKTSDGHAVFAQWLVALVGTKLTPTNSRHTRA